MTDETVCLFVCCKKSRRDYLLAERHDAPTVRMPSGMRPVQGCIPAAYCKILLLTGRVVQRTLLTRINVRGIERQQIEGYKRQNGVFLQIIPIFAVVFFKM